MAEVVKNRLHNDIENRLENRYYKISKIPKKIKRVIRNKNQ
jgi:hypothetical protein